MHTALWRRPAGRPLPSAPCRRPPSVPRSTAQRDWRWCWTGVSGWGRVAPHGCPGGIAGCPCSSTYVADPAERAWRCGDLFWWMAAREFDVRIDRTWPLSDAARAHRYIEGGNTKGKVLILH